MLSIFSKPLSHEEQTAIIDRKVKSIVDACQPKRVLLIGSAARLGMTEASDVDLVVLCDDGSDLADIRKRIALARAFDPWPQDILLISESDFAVRSKIGGVFWIAVTEGVEVFPFNHLKGK